MKFNIKEKILSLKDFIKNFFSKYPLTMIIIFTYTILGAFVFDLDFIKEEWIEKIVIFLTFGGIGAFFSENVINKSKLKTNISYAITLIISAFFSWYLTKDNLDFDFISKLSVCYIVTLIAVSLFFIIKNSKKEISEYLLKFFINITRVSMVYFVLAIGAIIIYEIFNMLILDYKGDFGWRIEILILGLYYVPKMIYSLIDMEEEVIPIYKSLVKYVLMTLVSIAFLIIYMYIIKILILRDMPKNQIFRILTALFVIGAPIWTCMQYFKDDSLSYKISLKLPFAFIPFIFLQIYTIGIRISENALTPMRYACVAFVIFEIIYILFYTIKKDKIQYLTLVANVTIIISIIAPVINMYDFSNISQANVLKTYKTKEEFSEKEKSKIYGAYKFLNNSKKGKEYIDNILNSNDEKEIKNFGETLSNYRDYDDTEYFIFYNHNKLNIKGYSTLINVEYGSGYNQIDDFNKIIFESVLDKIEIEVDLDNLIHNFIDKYEKSGEEAALEFIENNPDINVDNNSKIIITKFSCDYNTNTEKIMYLSIEGVYIEK